MTGAFGRVGSGILDVRFTGAQGVLGTVPTRGPNKRHVQAAIAGLHDEVGRAAGDKGCC
jgi:hypothetical protein